MGSFGGGGTWRARRVQAYNGGLKAEPPAGSRGRAISQGVRGALPVCPPEAESFLALGRAMDRANLYPLQYFQQSITIRSKCVRCRHSKIGGNNLFQIIQGTAKTNCTQVCFFACNLFSGVGTS